VDGARGTTGDAGFTMIEMIVALVIIGIVMTAVGTFFVSTVSATSRQGSQQAGAQLADDGIETVRSLKGTAVISQRDQNSSDTQWNSPVTGVAAYQTDMIEAYDPTAAIGAGAAATLPTTGQPTVVNGLTYTQNWYVGSCWQPLGGGNCGKVNTTGYASFYRVVVAVTWQDKVCPSSNCVFIATTLVSNSGSDPLFDSNQVATAPTVVNPGNQTSDSGVALTLQLTSTGGAGSITWSYSNLPAGLTMTSGGTISGTPTTVNSYSVVVSATDSFGLIGTGTFTWKIVAPPTISATAQSSTRYVADTYTPTASGGVAPLTWSASGLPAGLAINASNGTISGTPTAAAATSTVNLTVTDSSNQTGTASIVWTINAPPTLIIATPATQNSAVGTAITSLQLTASGGVTSYTWSATGYPAGLNFNTSTGKFTGTPTAGGTYSVTVTVTDSGAQSATTSAFIWKVLSIASPPASLTSARGAVIPNVYPRAVNGSGNYTWSATGYPAGLTFSTSTGQFSGTPSTGSNTTYTFTLVVTDGTTSLSTSMSITWLITNVANITSPNSNQLSSVNVATSLTPASANYTGTSPTWSATGLPTGITIDPTTGIMSGTPTAVGTYTVALKRQSTGTGAVSDTQSFTWVITPVNITNPSAGPISIPHNTTIANIASTATGGTGTLTWSATGLPTGIFISSAGVISGKPTIVGTYAVVITVVDSVGSVDTQSITATVT
jgi:prepilin-type N-terminal cleavage/methylation domain-containing protein